MGLWLFVATQRFVKGPQVKHKDTLQIHPKASGRATAVAGFAVDSSNVPAMPIPYAEYLRAPILASVRVCGQVLVWAGGSQMFHTDLGKGRAEERPQPPDPKTHNPSDFCNKPAPLQQGREGRGSFPCPATPSKAVNGIFVGTGCPWLRWSLLTPSEKGKPGVSTSENDQLTVFLDFKAPCKEDLFRYPSESNLSWCFSSCSATPLSNCWA